MGTIPCSAVSTSARLIMVSRSSGLPSRPAAPGASLICANASTVVWQHHLVHKHFTQFLQLSDNLPAEAVHTPCGKNNKDQKGNALCVNRNG